MKLIRVLIFCRAYALKKMYFYDILAWNCMEQFNTCRTMYTTAAHIISCGMLVLFWETAALIFWLLLLLGCRYNTTQWYSSDAPVCYLMRWNIWSPSIAAKSAFTFLSFVELAQLTRHTIARNIFRITLRESLTLKKINVRYTLLFYLQENYSLATLLLLVSWLLAPLEQIDTWYRPIGKRRRSITRLNKLLTQFDSFSPRKRRRPQSKFLDRQW